MKNNTQIRLNCCIAEPLPQPGGPSHFAMVAYSGGIMRNFIEEEIVDVVVDLAGMKITRQSFPILFCHEQSQIVGKTTSLNIQEGRLIAEGDTYPDLAMPKVIADMQSSGIEWQASIGIRMEEIEEVGPEGTVVNGQFVSSCFVVRSSTLKEISFVLEGADTSAAALVFKAPKEGSQTMPDKDKKKSTAKKDESAVDVTPADAAKIEDEKPADEKLENETPADEKPADEEPKIDPESADYKAGYEVGYEAGLAATEVKHDEELVACERERCMTLVKQLATHPELLAKHLKAGSDLMRAKTELADVLIAAAAKNTSTGTKAVKFLTAAAVGENDLEASWKNNTDDCQTKFAKKEHFIAYMKKHNA